MRAKPSGHFGVEFSAFGRRFWLGIYPTAEKAVGAYDVAVWCAGRPKTKLNFLEIKTRADAEFLVPEGIRMKEIPMKKRPAIVVGPDEATMARFTWEHP